MRAAERDERDTHPPIPHPTQATGVTVPEVATLWAGGPSRCLGGGVRTKKIAFVGVKVYAVFLYVDAAPAAKELGVRSRGGFFDGDDDADYAQALVDGAFVKALRIDLVRDVDGATFVGALEEALAPRLRLSGDTASLDKFKAFLSDRKLAKGAVLALLWWPEGVLDVALMDSADRAIPSFASPDAPSISIESPGLCRALFEVYLGEAAVSPDARAAWARGARALLATESVKRDTRKGGP